MADVVLDASALLALAKDEPGGEQVRSALPNALISAVNLSEVIAKLLDQGHPERSIERTLRLFAVRVAPFDAAQAFAAGLLRSATRARGLSLGDRACLALARELGVAAVTADRAWAELDLGVEIRLVR